jgi:hypothetical protein
MKIDSLIDLINSPSVAFESESKSILSKETKSEYKGDNKIKDSIKIRIDFFIYSPSGLYFITH